MRGTIFFVLQAKDKGSSQAASLEEELTSSKVWIYLFINIKIDFPMNLLQLSFILGVNFIFLCFKHIIIICYRTQRQKKIKFKLRIKSILNIFTRFKIYHNFSQSLHTFQSQRYNMQDVCHVTQVLWPLSVVQWRSIDLDQ